MNIGDAAAARRPMMAMTAKSSVIVKPRLRMRAEVREEGEEITRATGEASRVPRGNCCNMRYSLLNMWVRWTAGANDCGAMKKGAGRTAMRVLRCGSGVRVRGSLRGGGPWVCALALAL